HAVAGTFWWYKLRQGAFHFDLQRALEMPFRTSLVAVQSAGPAVQRGRTFHDAAVGVQRSEAEGGHGAAEQRRDRRVHRAGDVQGRTVVHVIHGGALHQGGGAEQGEFAGQHFATP